MKDEKPVEKGNLRRDLHLPDAVGVGLGAVIGAGIFVVTGVAAGVAGPAFLVGLFIAGFAATCNGLSSAQLAANYPQSGGTYEYGYQVLNPWLGFSAGWMFLASKLSAGGVVAIGFGSYLAELVPGVNPKIAAICAAVFLMLANYYGIRKAGKLNLLIVGITICSLLYFIISGIPSFNAVNLQPFAPEGWAGII
jgi:APA family basic amino acid/polyamine antiporter